MSRQRQLILFFVIVFAFTWSIAGLAILAPELGRRLMGEISLTNPWIILAVYIPSLTSIGLTAALEGRSGLGRLVARLDPRRFHPVWFLIVLVGLPILMAVAMLLLGHPITFRGFGAALTALGLGLVLDPGPLGEEFGWRGYALPRLLDRFSPIVATLILGVIWAVWHLPAFYFPGMPQSQLNVPLFFVGAVSVSLFMTWSHLRSRGSILLAILIHLTANHGTDALGGRFTDSAIGFTIAAVLLLIGDWRLVSRMEPVTAERGPTPA